MLVLVDACNVLHVEGALPRDLAGVDLGELAELVARSRYRHDEVVLVMDGPHAGPPLPASSSRIRAIASGPGRTADEVIVDLLERSSSPRSVIVVSSDRAIRTRARRRRCRMVHSEAFLEQIGRDAHLEGRRRSSDAVGPPSASTETWIREFGLDDEALARLVETDDAVASPDAGEDCERSPAAPSSDSPAESPPADATPPPRRGRALEDARSLEEIDPRELERFDMGEWIDPPPPPNMPDAT